MLRFLIIALLSTNIVSSQYSPTPVYRSVPKTQCATSFTYQVGNNSRKGYYDVQPFGRNNSLGELDNVTIIVHSINQGRAERLYTPYNNIEAVSYTHLTLPTIYSV